MSLQPCKVVEFDHFRSGDVRRVQQAAFAALSGGLDGTLFPPQFLAASFGRGGRCGDGGEFPP